MVTVVLCYPVAKEEGTFTIHYRVDLLLFALAQSGLRILLFFFRDVDLFCMYPSILLEYGQLIGLYVVGQPLFSELNAGG